MYAGDSSALLSLSGDFDVTAAPSVRELLDRLAHEGIANHLAVDLTGCTSIDATGLGVLVDAQKAAKTPLTSRPRAGRSAPRSA